MLLALVLAEEELHDHALSDVHGVVFAEVADDSLLTDAFDGTGLVFVGVLVDVLVFTASIDPECKLPVGECESPMTSMSHFDSPCMHVDCTRLTERADLCYELTVRVASVMLLGIDFVVRTDVVCLARFEVVMSASVGCTLVMSKYFIEMNTAPTSDMSESHITKCCTCVV